MPYLSRTAAIIALFPLATAVGAQDNKDHDPLFASHDTLEVEVEAPFAIFYPGPFDRRVPEWPRHFIAYVKGAAE